ncbi:MAG: pyridoxal phosphate-dependent aminotransferase [Acidobacteriota bacterium]
MDKEKINKVGRASRRGQDIQPFMVMEVLERAFELEKQGRSIIHLEVGEPDFDTPEVIKEASARALRDGYTHYTHSMGRIELREAIAEWHYNQYSTNIQPENIVVSSGSSCSMTVLFAALLDPGDQVLITDPGYSCYAEFIRSFGGIAVPIRVYEDDGFQYPLQGISEHIRRNQGKVKALLVNSPSNPTGIVTPQSRLRELVSSVGEEVLVISDEIYHGLAYGEEARSIREFTADSVVLNGFSKLYAMTGWRLGYAVLTEDLVRPARKIQQNLFISAPDFTQIAAIAALREAGPDVELMKSEYDRRRKFTLARLKEMGLRVKVEPAGAFYVFINVKQFTDNVYEFVFELLESTGVALTPGVDFGNNGEGYIRLSYTNSMENIREGLKRLELYFRQAGAKGAGQ